jgi:PAS domain S-box-containing protein
MSDPNSICSPYPRLENAPISSAALLPLVWDQTVDFACALLDGNGTIVGWHGAAQNVFGYTEEEALGRNIDAIFSPEDQQLGMPAQERLVAAVSGRSEDDRWHLRKDGARVWITGTLGALRRDGKVVGFAKVMRNRTDLKMQIESLRNRAERAEGHLVTRDRSFARLAHELRNALAPLTNAAELLTHIPELDRGKFPLAILKRQITLIERMARDLSEVAQLNAGKLRLDRQPIDICTELQQIAETIRCRAEQKRQTLRALVPPTPLMITADRQRLHQIFFNLLDNSIKYTPEGGHIWLKCLPDEGNVLVRVEDDGAGISRELLPLIFDLFTQEAPEESGGGYGVGLSLVKDLVEAHGGAVEVRSEGKGRGSEFSVRLPLAPETEQ